MIGMAPGMCRQSAGTRGTHRGEISACTSAEVPKVWPRPRVTRMTRLQLHCPATCHCPSSAAKSHSVSRPCLCHTSRLARFSTAVQSDRSHQDPGQAATNQRMIRVDEPTSGCNPPPTPINIKKRMTFYPGKGAHSREVLCSSLPTSIFAQ
jgi:hypothetical protein